MSKEINIRDTNSGYYDEDWKWEEVIRTPKNTPSCIWSKRCKFTKCLNCREDDKYKDGGNLLKREDRRHMNGD